MAVMVNILSRRGVYGYALSNMRVLEGVEGGGTHKPGGGTHQAAKGCSYGCCHHHSAQGSLLAGFSQSQLGARIAAKCGLGAEQQLSSRQKNRM